MSESIEIHVERYPFAVHGDDELEQRFEMPCPVYDEALLQLARLRWKSVVLQGDDAQLFIQLLAVTEGSVAEATILWDTINWAVSKGYESGLREFVSRSSSYYLNLYGRAWVSERTYRKAMTDLRAEGWIVYWPQSQTMTPKFRLNWVALVEQLERVDNSLHTLPGVTL